MKHNVKNRALQRVITLLCAVVMLAALSGVAFAESYPRINDAADILTDAEEQALEAKAAQYAEDWGQDFLVYTTNSIGNKSASQAANNYFDESGYGLDSENSGVLFLLDMGGREYYMLTSGLSYYDLTDAEVDTICDAMVSDLSAGNYADAFDTYLDMVDELLAEGTDSQATSGSHSGLSEATKERLLMALASALVISVAFCVFGVMQLRSKVRQHSASDYVAGQGLHLTQRQDLYLYSNTTRVRRQENNGGGRGGGGGGGGHRGGGGGRF